MRKAHRLLAVPMALAMILAACSSDGNSSSNDTSAASDTTAPGAVETTTAPSQTPEEAGLARAAASVVDANRRLRTRSVRRSR